MTTKVIVDAGICGFHTKVLAHCDDGQNVSFDIKTGCEKINRYAETLAAHGPVDAYAAISPNQTAPIFIAASQTLTGCCAGCVVPAAVFKTMQVAAGLALPKNISIEISKEQDGGKT
jgi:hypothetical protein